VLHEAADDDPVSDKRRLAAIGGLLLGLAMIAGCALEPDSGPAVIGGYPIGDIASCQDGCGRFIGAAVAWLDQVAPGHPPVVAAEARRLGIDVLMTRSGDNGDFVVLLRLDDGSTRVTFVMCGVGIDPDRCSTMPSDKLWEYLRS
jgi:hypothetical protein